MAYNFSETEFCQVRRRAGFEQIRISLAHQNNEGVVDTNCIIIYTCSTERVCNNRKILQYNKKCKRDEVLHMVTNGISQKYDMMGKFNTTPIFTHCNPESLAKILSLKDVT